MIDRRSLIVSLALAPLLPGAAGAAAGGAHAFSFDGIEGGMLDLGGFAGRPVLVVNTASRCGFTYQYDGLQALYDRYRERGLVVLGVPSDDFGGQELDTEAEVKEFCTVNFAINFPMARITRVTGPAAHPFYRWARRELGPAKAPAWNFHKYLVAPDGRLVDGFGSRVEPMSATLTAAIEPLLAGA